MLDSAVAVISDPSDVDLLERIAVIARAAEVSTHARGLCLVELHTWLERARGWLRGRMPEGTDDLRIATTASTLVAAAEAAFRVWARCRRRRHRGALLRDYLTSALDLVRTGLDPHRTGSVPVAPPDLSHPRRLPMSSLLYRLGRWSATHAWRVVAIWVVVLAVVGAMAVTLGSR